MWVQGRCQDWYLRVQLRDLGRWRCHCLRLEEEQGEEDKGNKEGQEKKEHAWLQGS